MPATTVTHRSGHSRAPVAVDPKVYARRFKTLAVLALSLLVIGLDNTVLNVALPRGALRTQDLRAARTCYDQLGVALAERLCTDGLHEAFGLLAPPLEAGAATVH
jgi:hypothetical protein